MYRSTYDSERQIATDHEHIALVKAAIEKTFDHYFERFVAECQPKAGVAAAAAVLSTKFKVKSEPLDPAPGVRQRFAGAIDAYRKEADRYRGFFNEETLDEYRQSDPKIFKRDLAQVRNCRIIADCVKSPREDMRLWQAKFAGRSAVELLDVFTNLFNAAVEYSASCERSAYAAANCREDLQLDQFDNDETLRADGVVGNGIKSYVLYHLFPDVFPICARQALFALYFLSNKEHFGLESGTSEFLMIDDTRPEKQIRTMEHNYWYPYSLLTWHRLELSRLIESRCAKLGIAMDPNWRYVYTSPFVESIVSGQEEVEALRAMRLPKDEDHW